MYKEKQKGINDKNRNRKTDNKKDIELNKTEARVEQKERDRDLSRLVAMPEFKRFMWLILGEAGVFTEPFTGNSETFYKCGYSGLGRFIMKEIETYSPRALHEIMGERVAQMEKQQLKEMETK